MAINYTLDTFKIYDKEFQAGVEKALDKNLDVFNTATRGAIILTTESLKGQYEKKAIFKALSQTTIKQRDPKSVATIVFDTLDEMENIGVKVNRYSAIQKTADAFAKLAQDPQNSFSSIVGVLTADLITMDMIETAVSALMGATQAEATHVIGDGTTDMSFNDINAAQFAYGDQYKNVVAILMHSTTAKAFTDVNIAEKMDNVGGVTIQNGTIASLGLPIIISDIDALTMTTGKGVLVMTTGAVTVTNSETPRIYTDFDPTTENTMLRIKREWSVNVACKGASYTKGTPNPINADLADKLSWTITSSDTKGIGAVIINSKT